MSAPRILLVGFCVLLGACAGRRVAPLQRYSLGTARAEYRDYVGARASLCNAEPQWLADELNSVNGLLSRFLLNTREATNLDAPQQAEELELLREATRGLPPVMKIHRQNLAELSECGFRRTKAFPELARRGTELLTEAETRLAEAPAALAMIELRSAQRKWEEEVKSREATAKGTWCAPDTAVGNADVYFARQAADGQSSWLFCDGLKVESSSGSEPQLVIPEELGRRDRRRIQPQHYLDAAKAYPASEIDRQPGTHPGSGGDSQQASRGDS